MNHVDTPKPQQAIVIHTDMSKFILGDIMTQDGFVNSCISKKFNKAQMKYPTMEQELLVIAETLKCHHYNIYGGEVAIKTNHKNLTHDKAHHTSQWVLHQCLLIDQEDTAKLEHYKDSLNMDTDDLRKTINSQNATLSCMQLKQFCGKMNIFHQAYNTLRPSNFKISNFRH